ncbi:MAG: terminase family protein, partial [Planctomycetota bacterium]|nr:terminase family protein [Planctomycetota bacterium]
MATTLTNDQIRYAGRKILLYQPRPAAKLFHQSRAKNRWLFGGNRSGKSEANIGFDLCSFALGLHPYRLTPKNATIWAAANTWDLVGKLLWMEKIQAYLPMSQITAIVWHNKGADIPKELRLRNGNRIEFKAYEQGRKVFEGRAIDAFYGDEQCKSDAEGVWQEIQARLLDKGGFSAQSMTPILYQPWLEDRIKDLPDTDAVFYADLNDNRRSR